VADLGTADNLHVSHTLIQAIWSIASTPTN